MGDCDTVFRRGNVGVGRCRVVTIAWPCACLPCPVLFTTTHYRLPGAGYPVLVSGSGSGSWTGVDSGSDRVSANVLKKAKARSEIDRGRRCVSVVEPRVEFSRASSPFSSFLPSWLLPSLYFYLRKVLFPADADSHTDTQTGGLVWFTQRQMHDKRPPDRPSRWFMTDALSHTPLSTYARFISFRFPVRAFDSSRVQSNLASASGRGRYVHGVPPPRYIRALLSAYPIRRYDGWTAR